MTFPDGWPTVTVNAAYPAASPVGPAAAGTVDFDTVPARLPSAQYGVIAVGTVTAPLVAGAISVALAATDSLTGTPFVWRVTENLVGEPVRSYYITIPAGTSPVTLATAVYDGELPATYTVIDGPQGLKGDKGDRGQDGGGGNYDPEGSADQALTDAKTYTDEQLALEATRADEADGAVLQAAKDYADAHSGGGGGAAFTTVQKYIKAEILTMVSSASYQVVTTSGGTGSVPISCRVPAAATNRLLASTGFLRSPAGLNLDISMLLADGVTPSVYGATGDGTTGEEGNVSYYPQGLNFPQVDNEIQFIPGAEHIDADGMVTIALVSQGTADGSQRIYAGGGYFFRWLLKNLDRPQT